MIVSIVFISLCLLFMASPQVCGVASPILADVNVPLHVVWRPPVGKKKVLVYGLCRCVGEMKRKSMLFKGQYYALQGYTGPGITGVNEMNFVMNHDW